MSQPETESTGEPWSGVVAVEGKSTIDGRLILPNALVWKTPVPLIDVVGWKIIGRVDVVEREGDLIRAAGVLFGPSADGDYRDATAVVFVTDVTYEKGRKDVAVFTSAALRSVSLIRDQAAWPECSFEL